MTSQAVCLDPREACGVQEIDGRTDVRRNRGPLSDDVCPPAKHDATFLRLGGQLFDPHAGAVEPQSPGDRARDVDLTYSSSEPARPERTRPVRRSGGVHRQIERPDHERALCHAIVQPR